MSLLQGEDAKKSSTCTYTMLSDGMPKMYALLDVAWDEFMPYPVTITDISKEPHCDYVYTQIKTYMEIGGVKTPFLFDITPRSDESEKYTMDIRFEGDDPIDVNEFAAIKFQTITLFDVPEYQLVAKMKEAYQGIQGDLNSLNRRIMHLLDSDDSIIYDHESVDVADRFEYNTVPNSPRSFESFLQMNWSDLLGDASISLYESGEGDTATMYIEIACGEESREEIFDIRADPQTGEFTISHFDKEVSEPHTFNYDANGCAQFIGRKCK